MSSSSDLPSPAPQAGRTVLGKVLLVLLLASPLVVAVATIGVLSGRGTRGEAASRGIGALLVALVVATWAGNARRHGRRVASAPSLALLAMLLGGGALVGSQLWSMNRPSRVRHAMSDMRSLAAALGAYEVDYGRFPVAKDPEELVELLEPEYGDDLHRKDPWGHAWRYETSAKQEGKDAGFLLGSAGEHGIWEQPRLAEYLPGFTDSDDDDIVFDGERFLRVPESLARKDATP